MKTLKNSHQSLPFQNTNTKYIYPSGLNTCLCIQSLSHFDATVRNGHASVMAVDVNQHAETEVGITKVEAHGHDGDTLLAPSVSLKGYKGNIERKEILC